MNTLKELAFSKVELLKCNGYNDKFIDEKTSVSLDSILDKTRQGNLPVVEGRKDGILHYTDLSVCYDSQRKIPFFSAYNINGGEKKSNISRSNVFHFDPRIPDEIQLNPDLYAFK